MNGLLFYIYAGVGMVLLLSGLDLFPPTFSAKWWLIVMGYALLANAFKPVKPE